MSLPLKREHCLCADGPRLAAPLAQLLRATLLRTGMGCFPRSWDTFYKVHRHYVFRSKKALALGLWGRVAELVFLAGPFSRQSWQVQSFQKAKCFLS